MGEKESEYQLRVSHLDTFDLYTLVHAQESDQLGEREYWMYPTL